MSDILVVENPRRKSRKRRRTYTAKQRAYGFGGGKRRKTTRRRRSYRRNPSLAVLSGNPRRRRSYRRNPSFGLGGLFKGFDFMSGLWAATGIIGSNVVPNMVKKFWPGLPMSGPMGYLVKIGAVGVTGMVVGMVTKGRKARDLVFVGGLAAIFAQVFTDYIAPMVPGLSGLGQRYIDVSEISDAMSGSGVGQVYYEEQMPVSVGYGDGLYS